MSSVLTPSNNKLSDIYHDIYDFSLFPISLGDIITWGVKSALRASAVGREKVHIHLICDPDKSGFNPLQSGTYLVDLFVTEVIPAFYSHPYFSGLSVYRSREDFREAFFKLAKDDDISLKVCQEHESKFKDRDDLDLTCQYFNLRCTSHDDINECYQQTGRFPKLGYLKDCLIDWHALQSQFSTDTFWVTFQFRLRKMDSGMPVGSTERLSRDAPFVTWYDFIREANGLYPSVRFVLLGRLQEKPLELLRLPNVVVLRTLGMSLGHEITALLNSDLYMGSASGFAQAAHFSDVPYDIFSCTSEGCKNYGIPYETEHLPIALPRQRLHYGLEQTGALLESLKRALQEGQKSIALPDTFRAKRIGSTDRFFINDDQSEAELARILLGRFKTIAFAIERGEYVQAQDELTKLGESFPRFARQWSDFNWLSSVLDILLRAPGADDRTEAGKSLRNELLVQVSRYCHPSCLIRRGGRYFDNLFCSEGFRRDGWCEQKAKLTFSPSDKGDFLIIQIGRVAKSQPTRLSVRINRQKPMSFVLLNEHAALEIPILELSVPTEVTLESDRAFKLNLRDEKEYSFQIDGADLVSKQTPMPTFFRGNKSDAREKLASGIYTNGAASNLARIRIDNPFPGDVEIMAHIVARQPQSLRKGQFFRIQINHDEPHESFISGKHLMVSIPCPGRPRYISILLQFWDRNGSETEPTENRAIIKSIDILPTTVKSVDIKCGYRGALGYLLNNLKSKISKRFS